MNKLIILIDPGHGVETAGKRSPDGTLREYEFNRAVARLLKTKLEAHGFSCRLTVEDDKDVPLRKRTDLAEVLKARGYQVLLVSIHANAAGEGDWHDGNGIETFTNNSAEQIAQLVQTALVRETGLRDRQVRRKDLHITRETAEVGIPAILVELGFMTNRKECELLKTATYREKCAVAITKAICQYYNVKYVELTDNPQNPVDKPCNIEVNGKLLTVKGKNRNGVTRLPIRAVAESVGVEPEWCETTKQVRVNGKDLDETIEGGMSYAPSRQLGEALGLEVDWVKETDTVTLKKA